MRMTGALALTILLIGSVAQRLSAQPLPGQQAPELHPLLVLLVSTVITAVCLAIGSWIARR